MPNPEQVAIQMDVFVLVPPLLTCAHALNLPVTTAMHFSSRLLVVSVLVAFPVVGCGSESTSTPADTGTDVKADTAKPDTGKADTVVDTAEVAAISCESPPPSTFKCVTPVKKTGENTCNEAALTSFVTACFEGDEDSCNAWIAANAACDKCVTKYLSELGYLDRAACWAGITPGDPCVGALDCMQKCREIACEACNTDFGSGTTADTSEQDDCLATTVAAKGACYENSGKKAASCEGTKYAVCDDVLSFFRGACRDSGDWSKATSPAASKIGPKLGTDISKNLPRYRGPIVRGKR